MGFQPGHKLGQGRPKGSTNTATLEIKNKLKEAGFDPVKEFLAKLSGVDDDAKAADLIIKFMKFVYPTLANVEATVDDVTDPDKKPVPLTEETMLQFIKAARGG